MASGRKFPITFRQEEVGLIMQCWRGSMSCSLVGVGSVGKSNLIQHLMDSEVQKFYMTEIAGGNRFQSILIDPLLLLPLSTTDLESTTMRCWAGYELMMHRLFLAFYPFSNLSTEDARVFYETYQALQDGTNPLYSYMGLRYFELGLEIFMRQGIQIVFMFDEFEEMLKQLPTGFFLTLRGLRDRYKSQISFMTFSRSPILDIVKNIGTDVNSIEAFTELFADNIVYVASYNDADAHDMLDLLMKRTQKIYPEYVLQFLMWASGCHAGLLRSSFNAFELITTIDRDTVEENRKQIVQKLSSISTVQSECDTIWGSLSAGERDLLMQIPNPVRQIDVGNYETQRAFSFLVKKKLAGIKEKEIVITPPIFSAYIHRTFVSRVDKSGDVRSS